MKITAVSDFHGEFPHLTGGDVLILAGDLTSNDTPRAWEIFFLWLELQKYRKKFVIAGNHDNFCSMWVPSNDSIYAYLDEIPSFSYLCDSAETFEGYKFWGSPWSLEFEGINPHCKAFTGSESELKRKFDLIPLDTDILITHSPPYGILDYVTDRKTKLIRHYGSQSLREKIDHVKPLYNIFGHIHENGGESLISRSDRDATIFANVSQMDKDYEFHNRPFDFNLEKR